MVIGNNAQPSMEKTMTRSVNPLNAILNWLAAAESEFRTTQSAVNRAYDKF